MNHKWILFFSVLLGIGSLTIGSQSPKKPSLEERYHTHIKPILQNSCSNCHSTHTEFPIYYNIPFVKSLIDDDVRKARKKMLMTDGPFMDVLKYNPKEIEELENVLQKNSMPPLRYRMLHWGTGLSNDEEDIFMQWLSDLKKYQKENLRSLSQKLSESPISPIPMSISVDTDKVNLGQLLFHDTRLSKDKTVSCAHCHSINSGGADARATSPGVGGAEGKRNSPSVFNSAFNFKQFWDGRADTLEEQIDGPIESPLEMGMTWPAVVERIQEQPAYRAAFSEIYGDGITPDNIKNAIAEFQRSLITPNARFDRFLRGEESALTAEEKEGYALFKSHGCVSCHQGVNVGGNLFEKFGVMGNYFEDRGNLTEDDWGRYNITKKERDKFKFKVPSLRNVKLTAPYFHDGSVDSLHEAVKIMAKYQLGRDIPKSEADKITQFLGSLTGELNGEPLE